MIKIDSFNWTKYHANYKGENTRLNNCRKIAEQIKTLAGQVEDQEISNRITDLTITLIERINKSIECNYLMKEIVITDHYGGHRIENYEWV